MSRSLSTTRIEWGSPLAPPENAWVRLQLGPLHLWALRARAEWRIATLNVDEADVGSAPSDEPPPSAVVTRFGFSNPPLALRLHPALADRAVIVSPADPFLLPPREEVELYVSTPVWVVVTLEDRPSEVLLEVSSQRPSDTWFGPSTRVGELCYAARTRARLTLEEVEDRPHRAVAVVRIANRARTLLTIERLRLPVPAMSLYVDGRGRLWTEPVTLARASDDERASVQLGGGPPTQARGTVRLAEPRNRAERGLLERTFGGIIREIRG